MILNRTGFSYSFVAAFWFKYSAIPRCIRRLSRRRPTLL